MSFKTYSCEYGFIEHIEVLILLTLLCMSVCMYVLPHCYIFLYSCGMCLISYLGVKKGFRIPINLLKHVKLSKLPALCSFEAVVIHLFYYHLLRFTHVMKWVNSQDLK